MFSLEDFHQEYETDTRDIVINGKKFQFFVPGSIERFIDSDNPLQDFPLWAKIWPAGTVLAGHLSQIPIETGKKMLEIGSGIGLVGIVAADAGHNVMATDYNAHALDFVRANSLLNNCPRLKVSRLDWNKPHLEDDYDYIIGSEVVYREQDIQLLQVLVEMMHLVVFILQHYHILILLFLVYHQWIQELDLLKQKLKN